MRQKQTHRQNRLVVARGRGSGGGRESEFGVSTLYYMQYNIMLYNTLCYMYIILHVL